MVIETESLILRTDFLLAYASGLIVLVLFCIERFNIPTNTGGSFIESLVPRAVSNGFQYTQTFVIYVTIMTVIYTGLSAVGPHVFEAMGMIDKAMKLPEGTAPPVEPLNTADAPLVVPAWVPLTILVILTGGATHYPLLNKVEFMARRLTHRLIGIPQNVESLAANIRDRRVDLERLSGPESRLIVASCNQIAETDVDNLEAVNEAVRSNDKLRRWLRLNFLHHMMEATDLPSGFGDIVRHDYRSVWKGMSDRIKKLRDEPELLRLIVTDVIGLSGPDSERREIVIRRVDNTLHDLHALIAVGLCPVYKDKAQVKKITDALRLIEGDVEDYALLNRVIFALLTLFLGVLALVYVLQRDPLVALEWASGAFALHGAAALSAWRFYLPRARSKNWESLRLRDGQLPMLQYLKVAGRGYVFGTIALALWFVAVSLLRGEPLPVPSLELIWIPAYGVVGVLTAFWVAYDFDIVHEQSAPLRRKAMQVVAQAVTTAAVALFITVSLQASDPGGFNFGWWMVTQIGVTTMVAAAILGFIAVFLSLRPIPVEDEDSSTAREGAPV